MTLFFHLLTHSLTHSTYLFIRNREVMSNETGINYDLLASECYFSSSYHEAKELFLRNVEKLRINNVKVSSKAMKVHGELTTDVAVIHGNKDKYILHISGTHGPEGFAGSAVQSAMLEYLYENKVYNNLEYCSSVDSVSNATILDETCMETGLPTIVFVHALNPYGMANNRRFNEDNVDLNRNFLSLDEFHKAVTRDNNIAGYDDFWYLLNPVQMPTSRYALIHSLAYSITGLLTHSLTYSLTHLLTHLLTHILTHSHTHSLTYSLIYLLNHLLTHEVAH